MLLTSILPLLPLLAGVAAEPRGPILVGLSRRAAAPAVEPVLMKRQTAPVGSNAAPNSPAPADPNATSSSAAPANPNAAPNSAAPAPPANPTTSASAVQVTPNAGNATIPSGIIPSGNNTGSGTNTTVGNPVGSAGNGTSTNGTAPGAAGGNQTAGVGHEVLTSLMGTSFLAMNVSVGTPAQNVLVSIALDETPGDLRLAGCNATTCAGLSQQQPQQPQTPGNQTQGNQTGPSAGGASRIFDTSKSTTFKTENRTYTAGSGMNTVNGTIAVDTVTVGGVAIVDQPFVLESGNQSFAAATAQGSSGRVSLGLHGDNSSLGGEPFYRTMAKSWPAPEFGLFVSPFKLDDTMRQQLENSGELALGGLNKALYTGEVRYIPTKGDHWALQLNDIMVDGISIMNNDTVAAGSPASGNSSAGGAAGAPGAGSAPPVASSTVPVPSSAAPVASAPVASSPAPQASAPVASAPAPAANSPSIQARQEASNAPAPAPPSGSTPVPAAPSAPAPSSVTVPAAGSPSAPAPASPSGPAAVPAPAPGGNATTNSTGGAAGGVPSPSYGMGTAALWLAGGSLISEELGLKLIAAIPGANRTETTMPNFTAVTYQVPCTTNATLTMDIGGYLLSIPPAAWVYSLSTPGGTQCAAFFTPLNETYRAQYGNDTQVVLGLNVLQTVYTAFRFPKEATNGTTANSTVASTPPLANGTAANATAPASPLVNPNRTAMIGFAPLSDAAKGVVRAAPGNSTNNTIPGASDIPVVTATGAGVSVSGPAPSGPQAGAAHKVASSVGGVLVAAALAFVAL